MKEDLGMEEGMTKGMNGIISYIWIHPIRGGLLYHKSCKLQIHTFLANFSGPRRAIPINKGLCGGLNRLSNCQKYEDIYLFLSITKLSNEPLVFLHTPGLISTFFCALFDVFH